MVQQLSISKSIQTGVVARVTYFAADTGYAILQVEGEDFSEFTAVGTMPDAKKGVEVEMAGEWRVHPKFGRQFAFASYKVPEPTGEAGMIAFLSTLKGVGEGLASRMIKEFGIDNVVAVLENESHRLLSVSGVGKKNLSRIVESFQLQKGMRSLISFLAEVGVSATYAARIYKAYGDSAIAEIKREPYILAEEVRGFGFKKADEVALAMGIEAGSKVRAIAGLMHTLRSAASLNGHCFLVKDDLLLQVCTLLALPDFRPQMSDIDRVVGELERSNTKRSQKLVVDSDRVYLHSYFEAEEHLAIDVQKLAGEFESEIPLDEWIAEYEINNGVKLAIGQKAAIVAANTYGLTVVTGGAGVGKSTVSKAVIQSWHERKKRVIAAAPTGKAAQRIREATGLMSASTIHRLLGWNGNGFTHNQDNPLPGDAFLIDEFSMVDLRLANSLFQAIPPHAIVMMVGDVNQLSSVGAGNVLCDVIESGEVPVVRLTEVFRQGATSKIIQASQSINEGKFPVLEQVSRSSEDPVSDALWIKCGADRIPDAIAWLLTSKLPSMGWQQDDIQVLSPMHKGEVGNIALNAMIQNAWNPARRGAAVMGNFRVGDRVIQTANDYDKKVFNGDIGKIEAIDSTDKEMKIRFPDLDKSEGRIVVYESGDLDNLMLAYSISIHKSQGSEFPVVVIPATMSQYMMLQRNLYYTGITRGKKLIVLVGEEKAIQTAVKTQKLNARNTSLAERISK